MIDRKDLDEHLSQILQQAADTYDTDRMELASSYAYHLSEATKMYNRLFPHPNK